MPPLIGLPPGLGHHLGLQVSLKLAIVHFLPQGQVYSVVKPLHIVLCPFDGQWSFEGLECLGYGVESESLYEGLVMNV